MRCKTDLCTCS